MITTNYREAIRVLIKHKHGTMAKSNGTTVSGALFDIQSPANDPDGIGYVLLKQSNTSELASVYKNEFAGLVEVW